MTRWHRSNYVSKNGFSPQTNREVGSFVYSVTFLFVTYISFQIWKERMFTEVWFYAAQAFAYWFVGWFLVKVGFWVYRPKISTIIWNLIRKLL